MHVLPVSSFLECPKFLGPHQEFSCHHFPSLVERQELYLYTSGSAGVSRLAPYPIGRPSLPARYALGVGERCGEWTASQWHTIPPLRLRPHQRFLPSSSALPHVPICLVLSREAPQGSGPAFASGDVGDATDATTQPVSAPLQSSLRFLPDCCPHRHRFILRCTFPLLQGSGMDLSCSIGMTRWVRSTLYADSVDYP